MSIKFGVGGDDFTSHLPSVVNEILPVKSKPKRDSKGKFIGSKPETRFLKLCEMKIIGEEKPEKFVQTYVHLKKAILGENIYIDCSEMYQPIPKHWWSSLSPFKYRKVTKLAKIYSVDSGVREILDSLYKDDNMDIPIQQLSPETKEEIKKQNEIVQQVGGVSKN
jgi:hypothetical protein